LESGTDIDDLPTLYTNPGTLNFGAITDILALTVENGGTGELVVDSVISRDPWLFVAPAEIDGNGLGTYSVRLRRNRLVEGQIEGSIDVSTNAGTRQVQVFAREAALGEDTNGNAGYHYILLVNADTGEIVQQNSRSVSEGQYPFQFSDVPAGRYQIIAGSDLDDNFQICDVGEACGAWPVFDGPPAVLDLDSDHSDLDFPTTFSIGLFSQSSNGSVQSGQARSGYRARQE
jgi:serine protease